MLLKTKDQRDRYKYRERAEAKNFPLNKLNSLLLKWT